MSEELTYHITHNDLDGYGCDFVTRKFFSNLIVKNVNYPDVPDQVAEALKLGAGRIIISDVWSEARHEDMIEMLRSFKGELLIFDHHKTVVNKQIEIAALSDKFHLFHDTEFCGTALTAHYFDFWLPSLTYINTYDLSGTAQGVAGDLNALFWEMGPERTFQILDRLPFDFNTEEKGVLSRLDAAQKEEYDKVLKTLDTLQAGNYLAAFIEGHDYKGYILDRFRETYDPVILYDAEKQTYSIRSHNPIARPIAEAHGGGGHDKAAGISKYIPKEQLKATVLEVLSNEI